MKSKATNNPYAYCPICGACIGQDQIGHKCKPSVLRGIDAANTRALRSDDDASDKAWHPPHPDYYSRLKRGFRMLEDDE